MCRSPYVYFSIMFSIFLRCAADRNANEYEILPKLIRNLLRRNKNRSTLIHRIKRTMGLVCGAKYTDIGETAKRQPTKLHNSLISHSCMFGLKIRENKSTTTSNRNVANKLKTNTKKKKKNSREHITITLSTNHRHDRRPYRDSVRKWNEKNVFSFWTFFSVGRTFGL